MLLPKEKGREAAGQFNQFRYIDPLMSFLGISRLQIQASDSGCSRCRPSESLQFPRSDLKLCQGRLKRSFHELQAATCHLSDEKIAGRWLSIGCKKNRQAFPFGNERVTCRSEIGKDTLGFCSSSELKEYMFVTLPLHQPNRKETAFGVARATSHLHDHSVIHWDIKPHKMLLGKNFEARIGDFRMVIFMDKDEEKDVSKEASFFTLSFLSTRLGRADSCLDPEYSRSELSSVKSDVYSFGVTLLELIRG